MAVKAQEVQVLGAGIEANAPSKGAFALNMLYANNAWQVREGFGQVTQFDTMMTSTNLGTATGEWGLIKHLGSHLFKADFGNLQMLSVFLAEVSPTSPGGPNLALTYSQYRPLYIVSIYDLTTNERFEVPLYPHTSQTAVSASFDDAVPTTLDGRSFTEVAAEGVENLVPQYQTAHLKGHAAWIKARDEFFFFEEFNDILYFGNSVAGCWAYLGASFNGLRETEIDNLSNREWSRSYGESNIITPVVLSPGVNPEAFEYLRTADMPNPVDVAVVQNRLVYASGNTLFWSDTGFPNASTANNYFQVPSEEQITAIAEQNSNLVVFTENETWLYQPSVGETVSQGRLTRVSDNVGCVGPNANTSTGGGLVWVDSSGVYQTANGLSIKPISEPVQPFFEREGMANPLTSYFVQYGQTDPDNEQPTTTLRLKAEGVKCVFVASMNMLVISVPLLSAALVMSEGRWSWWTFESIVANDGAGTPAAVVGVTQNMPAPWILNYQDDLFALAGPDVQTLTDDATDVGGTPINFHMKSRSFIILEYGRGGAIDRSVDADEDNRRICQYGHETPAVGSEAVLDGAFYFGAPIPVPAGYRFPSGNTTAVADRFALIPVSIVVPLGKMTNGVTKIDVRISFDKTRWRPVFNHASNADVELMLPTSRLASAAGWTTGGGYSGHIKTYTTNTSGTLSVESQAGGYMQILFDAGTGTSGWYHAPNMNLHIHRHNNLLYLPFERLSAEAADDTSSMGIALLVDGSSNTLASIYDNVGSDEANLPLQITNRWSLGSGSVRKEDSVAQPVDWAYKSTNVGLEGGNELKMRGVWANMLSHGTGTDKLDTAWPYGLFNTLVGSDRKEWMAQIIDMSPAQAAIEQQDETAPFTSTSTLRTRVQKSDGNLVDKTFGTTGLVWGNPAASATEGSDGTVLIGDEDTSDISVSMSVKGQSFSVMHFGFIMNRAEKLWLEGVKAVFRVVGGRRRRGR